MRNSDRVKIYLWYFKISILIFLCIFLSSCSTTRYITQTKRSVIEQLLLTKSIDNALSNINGIEIKGLKIYIETVSLVAEEENYLKKAISLWCLEKGAVIVEEKNKADYIASVLVKSLGTDRVKNVLMGLPSLPMPFTGIATPQIDLIAIDSQKGYTEMEIVLYSAQTKQFIHKTKPLVGKTHFSTYKIFLIPVNRNNIF